MTMKRVKKEALIGNTLLFNSETDNEKEQIKHSFAMNHIDIISLDALEGVPVLPTTGTYEIYVRTDIDGGFKLLPERGLFLAKKTGGSLLPDGVAAGACFVGFPLEFKIVPIGVDVAVAYRVDIKQSSVQLSRTVPIETSNRDNVGVSVFIQDQTTQTFSLPVTQDIDTTTLDGAATRDTRLFDVAAGDGALITAGNLIEIGSASAFIQSRVLNKTIDNIEIDSPLTDAFADLSSVVIKTDDLKVDGSVTPQTFALSPEAAQNGDVTRLIIRMEATATMDSGTLGPLAALTNGIVIRTKDESGNFDNIMNFKTNGDFIAECFDHDFLPNNGLGVRLFVARLTWAGQSKHGASKRLDGAVGDELQVIIQDDLTDPSLINFTIKLQGHEVQE